MTADAAQPPAMASNRKSYMCAAGVRAEAIVDPNFAEQFAVARPTARYAAVLEALPEAYVGTDIKPVVEFLCGELAAAFKVGRPAVRPHCKSHSLMPWDSEDFGPTDTV